MITKNVKTILFASLIAALILPFSGMQFATAQEVTETSSTVIYKPAMVEYIEKVISQEGKNTEEKTVDDQTMKVTTITRMTDDNQYSVISKVYSNDELVSKQLFKITVLEDGNYQLVNQKLGIDKIFTSTEPETTIFGWGFSNDSGASIRLYDGESGTPNTVNLYDSYSACWTFNQAVMDVNISIPTVDVTWQASPYYLDECFTPHLFDRATVTHGSQTYEFEGQTERRGSNAFTNLNGGNGWYSVSINFIYGAW